MAAPTSRPPAVAGQFYPAAPRDLARTVEALLADAEPGAAAPCPKVLIVPHAGYVYSGPIAATAFARLRPHAHQITRVVLIGPAHRAHVHGVVHAGVARLGTPLGEVPVDGAALAAVPGVAADAFAHALEHALEVELPFLQRVLPHASIVPLLVGRASAAEVGAVLDALWGGPETVIVISSDLSHYLPYDVGRAQDQLTIARILGHDTALEGEDACGAAGLNGLGWLHRRHPLRLELLDLRSSGDTAGDRDGVVGYAALAGHEVAA